MLSWKLLLYYEHAYADGPQFTASSPLLKNVPNAYPGPFAKYLLLWEVLSVVYSHVTWGFCETPKNKKSVRLKTVQFLAETKRRHETLNVVDKSSQKRLWAWALRWRFFKGACRSLIPVLEFFFSPVLHCPQNNKCDADYNVEQYWNRDLVKISPPKSLWVIQQSLLSHSRRAPHTKASKWHTTPGGTQPSHDNIIVLYVVGLALVNC